MPPDDHADAGRQVPSIAFADNGHGIAPEIRGRILSRSSRPSPPARAPGLGLSTVKTIVDSHQGYIAVESALRQGTTFQIYLPAAERS